MTLVALAFNDDRAATTADPRERVAVESVELAVDSVERACEEMGWQARRIHVGGGQANGLAGARHLVEDLDRIQPDVVFNLIEAELMSRTEEDRREDFHDLFDFDEGLTQGFRIVLEEE